jgi:hypothetical protein
LSAHHSSQPRRRLKKSSTAAAAAVPAQVRRSSYCLAILEGRAVGGVTLWSRKSKSSIRIARHGRAISGPNPYSGRSARQAFRHLQKSTTLNLLADADRENLNLGWRAANLEDVDASFCQFKCARKSNSTWRFNTRRANYFRQTGCNRIRILVAVASRYFSVGRHLRWLRVE